ncbi:MAG: ribonuclease HI [Oscillospiraceae bacterium]|jgi:ribonuclease HI|nr:ribonuclease HI [Oscillospiraceae bacterium]
MKNITIYTDGACSGNPGPGGWGAVLLYGGKKREMSGGEAMTTNNRMELMGVIAALSALTEPCEVMLYTDSKYVSDAINKNWLQAWARNKWKRKDGPVKNPELWQTLIPLLERHRVNFVWVKGHAENEYNNRCDELAVEYRLRFEREK